MGYIGILIENNLLVSAPSPEWYLVLIDQIFLAIYIVELTLKLYVWRLRFFKQFWNNFGKIVISVVMC